VELHITRRLGTGPLTGPQRHDVLEVLEDRTERASTLLTTQLPIKAWHEAIGDPTLADAICDRLIHTAQVIELHGPSIREVRAKAQRGGAPGGPTAPATPKPAGPAGKGNK
jgi:DNA replication protein DnaC